MIENSWVEWQFKEISIPKCQNEIKQITGRRREPKKEQKKTNKIWIGLTGSPTVVDVDILVRSMGPILESDMVNKIDRSKENVGSHTLNVIHPDRKMLTISIWFWNVQRGDDNI